MTTYATVFATANPTPPAVPVAVVYATATTTTPGPVTAIVEPRDDLLPAITVDQSQGLFLEADVAMPTGPLRLRTGDIVALGWDDGPDGATWSLEVGAQIADVATDRWLDGPLLTEQAFAEAPPPGLGEVDLVLGLRTVDRGTLYEWPVLRAGVVDSATRPLLGSERVLTLGGPGYWGRFDRVKVSLFLEAGHGWTHGEIVREILRLMGLADEQLPGDFGTPLQNPVELHCEEGWPEAQLVADGDGKWLRFTHDDPPKVEAVPLVPGLDTEPVRRFTADQLVAGQTAELEADGDVATHYVVRGSVVQLPAGAAGRVTTSSIAEIWTNDFVIPQARWRQDGNPASANYGDLLPLPVDETPSRQLVTRTTTLRTTEGGCLVVEEVIQEKWFSPRAARYQLVEASPGVRGPDDYRDCFVYEPDAVRDDQSEAYEDPAYRFGEFSRVRTEYSWGEIRSSRGLTTDQRRRAALEAGSGQLKAARPGDLLLKATSTAAWSNLRRAIGIGADGLTHGVLLTADGNGVLLDAEGYFAGPGDPDKHVGSQRRQDRTVQRWWSVQRNVVNGDERGFKTGELDVTWGHTVDRKRTWRFSDDLWSSEEIEVGFISKTLDTLFDATGEASHTKAENEFDVTGQLVTNGSRVETLSEYLPQRENCTPDDALAGSNRKVSGEVFCETPRLPQTWAIDHPYIETDEAALQRARIECRRDNAPTVTNLTCLPDPRLRPGSKVVLHLPDAKLYERPGWIERLSCSKARRSAGSLPEPVFMVPEIKLDPEG